MQYVGNKVDLAQLENAVKEGNQSDMVTVSALDSI